MFKYNVHELSNKLGLIINNPNLYQLAFTHKKYATDETYERLEFLGDAVLNFIVCEYLYNRYNDDINVQESFLTDLKIKLVNSDILSWLCQCLDIVPFILQVNNFKFTNSSINEDVFESLIGAILLDHNFDVCKQFITNILENPDYIDFNDLILNDTNYKKKLFIYFQKKLDGRLPIFHTLYLNPSSNKHKFFHVVVTAPNGKVLGFGISNTLKMAQQSACKHAFEINDFNTNNEFITSEYKVLYNIDGMKVDIEKKDNKLNDLYNPNNTFINIVDIQNILNSINSNFIIHTENIELYQRCFINRSYYQYILNCKDDIGHKYEHNSDSISIETILKTGSNEKLNFLGNSLLIYILSKHLYNIYPSEKEGVLTKIKTSELQSKNLVEMCKKLNLNKYYILFANEEPYRTNENSDNSDNEISNVNTSKLKNLDEIFCSLLAVLYYDQGIDYVDNFVIHLWNKYSRFETFKDENYKHKLLLIIQENEKYKKYIHPYPKYVLTSETNIENKYFVTEVYDPDGHILAKGIGNTKRISEQNASKNALQHFINTVV